LALGNLLNSPRASNLFMTIGMRTIPAMRIYQV
jgi:hypothetical protein